MDQPRHAARPVRRAPPRGASPSTRASSATARCSTRRSTASSRWTPRPRRRVQPGGRSASFGYTARRGDRPRDGRADRAARAARRAPRAASRATSGGERRACSTGASRSTPCAPTGREFPVELTITRIDVPGPPVFTGHLRDITERRRAEAELRASRARIVAAADAARRRIERDLHDGAQQRLVSVAMQLRLARDALDAGDAGRGVARSTRPRPTCGAAIAELRELARGIHPAVLTEGGLAPALRGLAAPQPRGRARRWRSRPSALPARGRGGGLLRRRRGARPTPPATRTPQLVEIEVARTDGRLIVEVRDDGRGGADAERRRPARARRPGRGARRRARRAQRPATRARRCSAEVPCAS